MIKREKDREESPEVPSRLTHKKGRQTEGRERQRRDVARFTFFPPKLDALSY